VEFLQELGVVGTTCYSKPFWEKDGTPKFSGFIIMSLMDMARGMYTSFSDPDDRKPLSFCRRRLAAARGLFEAHRALNEDNEDEEARRSPEN
jgi:hypothetical protein